MTQATLEQIRAKGLKALADELGPVGMVRFLQQFETGRGDYSRERRHRLAGQSVRTLVAEIKCRRKSSQGHAPGCVAETPAKYRTRRKK